MSKKQTTLFEVWNKSSTNNTSYPSTSRQRDGDVFASTSNCSDFSIFQRPSTSKEPDVDSTGFDPEAGKTWIYPTNYPVREYQFSIVEEALFKNTLVILPTGLGKTFIAAVVMFNIYRWYPKGKVVFMAPTRPLVAQQIDACHKVTGIPQIDTTQMTGTNLPEDRKRLWLKKRVFFLTPQVLVNDLVRNICPATSIKCLVVDEAHKALGNQAYCQVITTLRAFTDQFRVLALTATPGSDTQAVRQVVSNLLISHVEMRSEESEDVKPYTHERDIEKIVVPLGDKLMSVKSRFLDVINIYLKRLNQRKAIGLKNPSSLSKFQVLKMREDFSQRPPSEIDKYSYGLILADFSLCISLYHAYELLLLHGARPFYNFLTGIVNGEKSIPHARSELLKNYDFKELMKEVEREYIPVQINQNSSAYNMPQKVSPGHPKLQKLLEVVLRHFNAVNKDAGKSTRVMIFSQYRDSVEEIVEMLNYHRPMIKAMSFIGQATKSGATAGFSQKHQLKVLQDFRSGGYNTLVSTCVGEEGLDIGEVDLIVCYDCPKSPIRLVQRMGRTGRLRKGSIIILVAEGKEEQMYSSCESKKKSIHKAITKGFSFAQLYSSSPSLLPPGLKPVCVKTSIVVETNRAEKAKPKGKFQESPFLNADEMVEYNNRFKFPKSDVPLLADSTIVSLSNPPQKDQSAKPRLSLNNWMLWQSTPQRFQKVSHSSRSLLLVDIVDKINFSSPLVPAIEQDVILSPPAAPPIADHNVDIPMTIDLCSDEDDIPLEIWEVQRNVNFRLSENKEDTLLKRLFGISFIDLPKMTKECTFEDPPNIDCLMSVEKLPTILIKDLNVEKCHETKSKLPVLCNKMKALWKRKSKEFGIDISFPVSNLELPEAFSNISVSNSTLKSPINVVSFDVSFLPPEEKHDSPAANVENCITFDIDFDAPMDFDMSENKENVPNPSPSKTDIDDRPESPFEMNTESSMFSEDASMIVDQLLSSKEDIQGNLDSSFSVPLTVKKVVLENNCVSPSEKMSGHETISKNVSGKQKSHSISALTQIDERNVSKPPVEITASEAEGSENLDLQSSPTPSPWRLGKMLDTEGKKANESEPTQCTMTQLLSLINTSGLSVSAFSPQKNFESPKKRKIESSEDEIEPTPPRERNNQAVKFCYRSNSFKSESQPTQKDGFDENEVKADSCNSILNEAIYFDLSDFSPYDILNQTVKESPNVTLKRESNLSKVVPKDKYNDIASHREEKVVPDHENKGLSKAAASLERKDICNNFTETNLPEKESQMPNSASFENICFDISFDIPEFDDVLSEATKPPNGACTANKSYQIPKQSENKSIFNNDKVCGSEKDTENVLKRKTKDAIFSEGRSSQIASTPSIEQNFSLKSSFSADIKTKSPSAETTEVSNFSSKENIKDFKFKVPNQRSSFVPQNQSSPRRSHKTNVIEFDLTDDFSSEPESESLIKQSGTIHKQGLDDSLELDDFEEPVTKNNKAKIPTLPKRKKLSKSKNINPFMLSQVDVSGSDSGDNVSCDEDLDALEDSFINDDDEEDTLCESPKDERCMYLQSVKDVAGLPRRFKFKENLNLNHSVYSQPVDEGCSKYLLDSFCVDEEECVAYSSSDEDVSHKPRSLPVNSKKKRKRIISESSSDEEMFAKKIKNSACESPGRLPNLKDDAKRTLKRIPSHRILSSDDDDAFTVKKSKKDTAIKSNVVREKQINQHNSVISFDLTEHQSDNIGTIEGPSKSAVTDDKQVENCNLSFDVGWDNFALDIEESFKIDKLEKQAYHSKKVEEQPIISTSSNRERLINTPLGQNKKKQVNNEWDDCTLDLEKLDNSSKPKVFENFASCSTKVDKPPIFSTSSNRESLINQNKKKQVSLTLPSPILPRSFSNSHSNVHPFHVTNPSTTSLNFPNQQKTSSSVSQVKPTSHPRLSSQVKANTVKENYSTSTINTSINASNISSSQNPSYAINSTILVDSRELASGKPVISALRNKHRVNPVVMQLNSADYILSNKVAVERVFDSEFSSNNMPPKIMEKVKAMSELYEKSYVLIEADSRKKVLGFNKLCTKYLYFSVNANFSNSIKMVYSRSFEETSDILFNLIQKETAKGFQITVPVTLNVANQKIFEFYLSIPHVSTICALNFVYHFPVIHMIFQASVEELKKAGSISTRKARLILEYLGCEMSFTSFS